MTTTIATNVSREYKDLDLNFTTHPIRKDLNKLTNEMAVINAVKNLVMTNHYERPFKPDIGSNVRALMFENMDNITATVIERNIRQIIENYEPRISIKALTVSPDFDNNAFSVIMEFLILNMSDPIRIRFLLERTR